MARIKFYGLSTCIHCRHTKEFLDEHHVSYDLVYVDTLEGQEQEDVMLEVKKHNPQVSFPTLLIGDKVVVGFDRSQIASDLGLGI